MPMFNILLNYFDALYHLFHSMYDPLLYYGIRENSMNYFDAYVKYELCIRPYIQRPRSKRIIPKDLENATFSKSGFNLRRK